MTDRPAAKTFQDLLVWQRAHQFVRGVYPYSAGFPDWHPNSAGRRFLYPPISRRDFGNLVVKIKCAS